MFPSFVKRADYLMKDSIVSATLYTLILENNGNLYFALGKQWTFVLCRIKKQGEGKQLYPTDWRR